MKRIFETKYQAFYLINNGSYRTDDGIDTVWDYQIDDYGQRYTYMIAMQKNNFDEVNVMINNVTIKTTTIGGGGYHYRTDADRSYRWDELPDRYVEVTSKRYRSHSNYDNIISYADMIQYLVENYHDIEVDSHGKLNIRVPFREKLRDYAGDIVISYDDNGLVLNCESKD